MTLKGALSQSMWICAEQISNGENVDLTNISPPPESALDRFVSAMLIISTNDENSAMNIQLTSSTISSENQKVGRFVDQAAVSEVLLVYRLGHSVYWI
jgi:hypothetical protein